MLTLTFFSQAEGLECNNQRLVPRWLWSSYRECTLVVWLSGFWAQRVSVANWKYVICQALRWRRRAWGGAWEPCPDFAWYTCEFGLKLRKITKTPHSGHPTGARRTSAVHDSFCRLGNSQAMVSTGLLVPAALDFRFRWWFNPPSALVSAELPR